jgi:hypothetical protein
LPDRPEKGPALIHPAERRLYEGDGAPDLVLSGLQGFALQPQNILKPGPACEQISDRFEGKAEITKHDDLVQAGDVSRAV